MADWQAEAGMGGARVDARAVRDAMRLYAVTDPGLNTKMGRTLAQAVRDAIQGGATIVQVGEALGANWRGRRAGRACPMR